MFLDGGHVPVLLELLLPLELVPKLPLLLLRPAELPRGLGRRLVLLERGGLPAHTFV
eukprot:SAG22_NODE_1556_length_4131_cov_3.350942_3_plen_57_part_00